jgi:hypothetical protein
MIDQVGGSHYSRAGNFQHWDLWLLIRPFDGNILIYAATKYLARLDMKEPLVGVRKSISYLEKYLIHVKQKAANPQVPFAVCISQEPTPLDRILQTLPTVETDPRIVGVYIALSGHPTLSTVENCVKVLKSYVEDEQRKPVAADAFNI